MAVKAPLNTAGIAIQDMAVDLAVTQNRLNERKLYQIIGAQQFAHMRPPESYRV